MERLSGSSGSDELVANHSDPGLALSAWSSNLTSEALGNLAHELRTPIQALMGRLEMLQEEYAAEIGRRPRELVQRMNVNAFELQQTLENLLAFVVAQAGGEVNIEEHLTLESIVADVEPVIAMANADKHLDVQLELDRAPAIIDAPRRAVTGTIINLALNAIKFTEAGRVTIAVRRIARAGDRATVEIEVSDSGPGLSPALFEEVSQPFAQLSRSSTRRFRGVGLGLAIVRQNVATLGGTLELLSAPGHGADIFVRFPQPGSHATGVAAGATPLGDAIPQN